MPTEDAVAAEKTILTEDQARTLLSPYIDGMLKWYWDETFKWERYAFRLQIVALILSALVTVVAAAPPIPGYEPWIKWSVVVLSALTTLASGLLSRSGVERTAQLRELGRIRLVTLKDKIMLRFTRRQMTDAERTADLDKLIDATKEVEEQFGVNPLAASRQRPNDLGRESQKKDRRKGPSP
jgi:hypothetical protein